MTLPGKASPSMELPWVAPLRPAPRPTTSESTAEIPTPLSKVSPLPPTEPPKRFLCFDVENRPLAYWWDGRPTAEITAIAWKYRDEAEPHWLLLTRNGRWRRDNLKTTLPTREAFRLFRQVLVNTDVVYGHNVRRHDLGLVNAAMQRLELPVLPPLLVSDTLKDLPKRKDMSASLENLAELYNLGAEKVHMGVVKWETANRLEPAGLAETRERVVGDVLLQERLRDKLLELEYLGPPRRWTP